MAIDTDVIATEVAALTVTGASTVAILDLPAIPNEVNPQNLPVLFPEPDLFVGQSSVSRKTFGQAANTSYWEELINLTWRYFHAVSGQGRSIGEFYRPMLQNRDALVEALMAATWATSGADVRAITMSQFGQVTGPNGVSFFGFNVTVTFWQQFRP